MNSTGNVKVNVFTRDDTGNVIKANWYITKHYNNGLIDPPVWERKHQIDKKTGLQSYTNADPRPLKNGATWEIIDWNHNLTTAEK